MTTNTRPAALAALAIVLLIASQMFLTLARIAGLELAFELEPVELVEYLELIAVGHEFREAGLVGHLLAAHGLLHLS